MKEIVLVILLRMGRKKGEILEGFIGRVARLCSKGWALIEEREGELLCL